MAKGKWQLSSFVEVGFDGETSQEFLYNTMCIEKKSAKGNEVLTQEEFINYTNRLEEQASLVVESWFDMDLSESNFVSEINKLAEIIEEK